MPQFITIALLGVLSIWVYGRNITLTWFVLILFVTPNFTYVPRINHRTNFYVLYFIWCPFWVSAGSFCCPLYPQKTPKGVWIGIFKKPNAQNIPTFKLSYYQNYKSNPTKFCTVIKTTKYSSRVVPFFFHKSKMVDGCHLEKDKSLYLSNSLTDFDTILHGQIHGSLDHTGCKKI